MRAQIGSAVTRPLASVSGTTSTSESDSASSLFSASK